MRLRSLLKKNRTLHFIYTLGTEKKFRKSYFNYIQYETHKKPTSIVKKELNLVSNYWKYPPYHYYRFKLYQKELSEDQLLDYIPPYFYFNRYWEKRNDHLDKMLYQSKIYQQQLFAKHNIPSVDVIATFDNNIIYNYDGFPITIIDLIEKYLKNDYDALFCKPEYGRGGAGIIHLSKKSGTLLLNNKVIPINKIMTYFKNSSRYIIQERFIQSEEMARINKSSVNTLRIYTQINNDGVVLPACILRMGVNSSFVDNLSQGGLMNLINVNDGSFSDYAKIRLEDRKYFEHPDSKYIFKNSTIKIWQEIKTKIIQFTSLIGECKDLGWDVAIGEDGFKVLEINIQHGIEHPQMIFGGMRRILKVFPDR